MVLVCNIGGVWCARSCGYAPRPLLAEIGQLATRRDTWPSHWSDAAEDFWFEIALAECKEYYRHAASERGLPESGIASTDAMLRNLLQDFSVSQVYLFIYGGAKDAADYLVRKKCHRSHAANFMIGACQRFADKARVENWEVKPFRRNFDLPRTSISHVFFDVFLKIGEDGFNSVPGTAAKKHITPAPSQQDHIGQGRG